MIGDEFTAPAPAGALPVEYASFGRRLGAALLDSGVWIIGLIFFNPFVFVGDTREEDVVGARAAGIDVLLLDRDGGGDVESLEQVAERVAA